MKKRVQALIWAALTAPLLLAANCNTGSSVFQFFAPGATVTDFDVRVQIQIPSNATFDPASDVKLNGVPILVTQDAPNSRVYSTTRSRGFPLLDQNLLEARAVRPSGVITGTFSFSYAPPKARLRQITNAADLIQGPLAHGRVGDWLFENSLARFIVQDVAKRDLYSVGAFGGNLIDLELKANPGNDNFIEIQPMLNIETVVNAQTLEVVNDGQDGTPAILRTCGPDDLLDFVNPSSTIKDGGITVPPNLDDNDQPVEACTEYRLDELVPWIRMETTVMNLSDDTEQRMLVGDWYNPGGQLEAWVRPNRLGEALSSEFSVFSHFGYDEFAGLDYAYTPVPLNPAVPGGGTSSQFTTSGVTVLVHSASVLLQLLNPDTYVPPFFVEPSGTRSFTRYVGVGDGSGSNAVAMEAVVKPLPSATIEGCVTVAGTPLPGSRVSVVRGTVTNITRQEGSVVTKAGGCPNYRATITGFGTWQVAAARRGSPYEGSLALPTLHSTGTTVAHDPPNVYTVNIDLPAPGRLSAHVTDETGLPLPARVSVVGIDPSPPITKEGGGLPGLGSSLLGLFEDPKEGMPFGIVAFGYSDVNGNVAFDVEPGTYQLVVSRGTEYSVHSAPVTITANTTTNVTPQITRVLDTSGFVSSDFHVHGIRSADSRVADGPRVAQFAGEGVENIIMTDHHVHTDLSPTIAALGLGAFVTSTVGEEITTFDYGHFNGYPFTIDPSVPSGGSTDWGQAAPPGADFPSAGAFNATPAAIHALATTGARATADTTVQINHIDSHFVPLQIDTSVGGAIVDDLDDAERAGRRLPSVADAGNLFHAFPALELWNGADRAQQENFLLERIGIWFNHLNKGLRATAISDTDTHTFGDLETAGARTWTAASTDLVPGISGGQVANSVDAGRAVGGQGLYVQTRLLAASTSQVADLTFGGSTDLVTTDGALDLEIKVQAPLWAQFDRIEVYANGLPAEDAKGSVSPYLFSADTPAVTLLEGDCDPATLDGADGGDFDITTVDVQPTVVGGKRQEVTLTLPFTGLTQDTWFAVVVRGTDGVCQPMFPVYPRSLQHDAVTNATTASLLDGNLNQSGTMALGVTNALYADVDGVAGFQPPNP